MNIIEAVTLAKEGKNDGVAYLYEYSYKKNYYVALKFVKDEELAKDLLQDAYIKAFDSINQLEKPEGFESWMCQIVARTALNELRKKNPILFTETENEDGSNIVDTFEDDRVEVQPEVMIDKNETSRLVQEMMADLSEEQRVCITMFYMEDLPVKDIAAIIGVSENTVKSRLNYGRQKIKDKVLALEKRGTKLYGIAPIPFFIWLLSADAEACAVQTPVLGAAAAAGTVGQASAAGASAMAAGGTGAAATGKVVTATITAKQIVAGAAAVVLIGGTTTGVIIANNHNKNAEEVVVEENNTVDEPVVEEETKAEHIDPLMQACGVGISDGVVYYTSDYVDDGEYALYKMDLDTQTKETLLTGMDYHEAAVCGKVLYTVESVASVFAYDAGLDEVDEEDNEEPTDTPLKIIRYDLDTMDREEIGSGSNLLVVGDKLYASAYDFFGESFGGEKIVSMDLNTDEVEVLADVKDLSDLGLGDDYSFVLKIFYYEGTVYTEYDYLQNMMFTADFKIAPNRDKGYKAFALDGTPATIEDKGMYFISPFPNFGEFSSVSSEFADKLVWNYAHVNYGWIYVYTNDGDYLINEDGTRIDL